MIDRQATAETGSRSDGSTADQYAGQQEGSQLGREKLVDPVSIGGTVVESGLSHCQNDPDMLNCKAGETADPRQCGFLYQLYCRLSGISFDKAPL